MEVRQMMSAVTTTLRNFQPKWFTCCCDGRQLHMNMEDGAAVFDDPLPASIASRQ